MKKSEKPLFITNLTNSLRSSTSVILVDYTGISVKKQQDLKKKLKAVDANMLVVKNTLFKLAAKNAKLPEDTYTDSVLTGPVALIITDKDPIAPIQIIGKFAKDNELPKMKVGVVENVFQATQALEKISKLPGKDVLFGQVVGSIASPMYGIVGTLNANLGKLVYVLSEASKK